MTENKKKFQFKELTVLILILIGTYFTSYYNFLLFHTIGELISIIIGIAVFIITWNSKDNIDNSFLLLLGISFLFTSVIDLIHTLSYSGMNIFIGYGANLPTSLWILARYMQAISIMIGSILMNRKLKYNRILLGYSILTSLGIFFILIGFFPICYVDGQGLTPFKIISEYIIDGILLASIIILIRVRKEFDKKIFYLIIASVIFTIFSELAFTFYVGVYDFSNLIGHLLKFASSFLIYMGIIRIGLQDPIDLLFRKLKQSEGELEKRAKYLAYEIDQKNLAEMRLREFISTVSHELRTPVTVLLQSTEMLKKQKDKLSIEQKNKLNHLISKNTNLLMALLENLLVLSRIDEKKVKLEWEEFNVRDLINENIMQMESRLIEKSIIVNIEGNEKITIFGDKLKISQIFRILIDNAIKYSDNDSNITIKIKDHYQGKFNENNDDGILLEFIDHGRGIHPNDLERIFDRFFRSSMVYEISGTGLGLTIAKELTEIHEGRIYVESELGKGSKFLIFLPRLSNSPLE